MLTLWSQEGGGEVMRSRAWSVRVGGVGGTPGVGTVANVSDIQVVNNLTGSSAVPRVLAGPCYGFEPISTLALPSSLERRLLMKSALACVCACMRDREHTRALDTWAPNDQEIHKHMPTVELCLPSHPCPSPSGSSPEACPDIGVQLIYL